MPPASARAAPSTLATVTQPSSTSSTASSTSTLDLDPSTSTSVPTTIAAVRTVTMAFSGDTLAHSPLWRRAARNAEGDGHDLRRCWPSSLRSSAPSTWPCATWRRRSPPREEYSTMPLYGVPVEIVDALAQAGYDRCSTASNHTADRGGPGIDRTVTALEAAGIAQSGMARTPEEIEPRPFEVNGISLAHLSYTFSYNGLSLPEGEEWRSATIDPERMIADAARARQLGAEVVVMSIHWGAEGESSPTTEQRRVADLVTASGQVDLIVGHHAHVVQPIEVVNGTWVVFGLGNILSNLPTSDRWPASSQDGEIVTVARCRPRRSGVGGPPGRPPDLGRQGRWLDRASRAGRAGRRVDLGSHPA
ncbi:MAG: CapA family protein [Ilumatobacteraceae bacterium]